MNKTSAILLAFTLIAGGLLLAPAVPATHGTPPSVRFVHHDDLRDGDFGAGAGTIHGIGSVLAIEVQEPTLPNPATVQVRVTSTSDATGETVTLQRAVPTAGAPPPTYYGMLGFETTAIAGNGRVRVNDFDTVEVVLADSTNTVLSSDSIVFRRAVSGTLETDGTLYFGRDTLAAGGGDGRLRATLRDADLNLNPAAAETTAIRVRSSSDPTSEVTMTLTETGFNTGEFTGELGFASDGSDDGPPALIQVSDPAVVTLAYDDAADARGNPATVVKTVDWREAGVGVVFFADANFRNAFDGDDGAGGGIPDDGAADGTAGIDHTLYLGDRLAYLIVVDQEEDVSANLETVVAHVTSDSQAAPLQVLLVETGPRTGQFQGTVQLDTAATPGRLKVASGDDLQATYDDRVLPDGSDPPGPSALAAAHWILATDGSVSFTRCDLATVATDFYGDDQGATVAPCGAGGFAPGTAVGRGHIVVADDDANLVPGALDTVSVTVSSSMDPSLLLDPESDGAGVTLTETGVDTGVFSGFVDFHPHALPPGAAGAATDLWVADGSTLTVQYDDIDGEGALAARTATATWHTADNARVDLDLGTYRGTTNPAAIANGPLATVTVIDIDADLDPAVVDRLDIQVSSDTESEPMSVLLTETARDGGVFRGTFGFRTTTLVTPGLLRVTDGDTITVQYDESLAADGSDPAPTDALRRDTATWLAPNPSAAIFFDSAAYYGAASSTVTVFLVDSDTDSDSAAVNNPVVNVRSPHDGIVGGNEGILVTLTETGATTNVYRGTFTVQTAASSDAADQLRVIHGSTFTVVCAASDGVADNDDCNEGTVAATARWYQSADAQAAVLSGDGKVSQGDYCYSTTSCTGSYAPPTDANTGGTDELVAAGDADLAGVVSIALGTLRVDQSPFGILDANDDFYNDVDQSASVTVNDQRYTAFTGTGCAPCPAGSLVAGGQGDIGAPVDVTAAILRVDAGAVGFSTTDLLYGDRDDSGSITIDDYCFNSGTCAGQARLVAATDADAGAAVSTAVRVLRVDQAPLGVADLADDLYADVDNSLSVSTGDFRFTEVGAFAAGSTVAGGNGDIGALVDRSIGVVRVDVAPGGPSTSDLLYADLSSVPVGHKMFGVNDPLRVLVKDADRNIDAEQVDTFAVSLSTPAGGPAQPLTLVETGPATGIFRNEAYFELDTGPELHSHVRLTPGPGSSVRLDYIDAGTFQDTLSNWYPAGSVLAFSTTAGGLPVASLSGQRTLHVQLVDYYQSVTDPGIGSTGLQDTRTLRLTSTATGDTETITLTETGLTSSIFRGTVDLAATAGAGRLAMPPNPPSCATGAVAEDLVVARMGGSLGDAASPAGDWVFGTVDWSGRHTAVIRFTDREYAPFTVPSNYLGLSAGYAALSDCDLNADPTRADTAEVSIVSASDGTGIRVTLTESGANTGEFRGTFGFTAGLSNDAQDLIRVKDNDLLNAVYTDAQAVTGQSLAVTNSVATRWQSTFTATVAVDRAKFQGTDSATLTVTDKDGDTTGLKDTVTVTLESFDLDGTPFDSETLSLEETAVANGIFRRSTINFHPVVAPLDPGEDTAGQIEVPEDGALLVASYADAIDGSGVQPRPPQASFRWYPGGTGHVTLQCFASCILESGATCASSCVGTTTFLKTTSQGLVRVIDQSVGSPSVQDQVHVWAFSNTDGSGEYLALTETGLNTHVFETTLGFELTRQVGNHRLHASNGDRVTVVYADAEPNVASGAPPTTDTATGRFLSSEPPIPILTFSANGLVYTFTVAASDDGSVILWRLDPDGDGDFDFSGAQNLRVTPVTTAPFTYPAADTYIATLVVVDDTENTNSSSVEIVVQADAADTTPPAAVTGLTIGQATTTAFQLSWTAPGDDGMTGTVAGYRAKVSTTAFTDFAGALDDLPAGVAFAPGALVAGGGTQTGSLTGLLPETTYFVAIKAYDNASPTPLFGGLSNVASGTTLEGEEDLVPPGGVTNLDASNPTPSGVTLTWTAPGDDDQAGTVAGYLVKISTAAFTAFTEESDVKPSGITLVLPATLAGPGLTQTATLAGLSDETTYFVAVRAIDNGFPLPNAGAASQVVSFTTEPIVAPPPEVTDEEMEDANREITASLEFERTDDGLLLTWDASDGVPLDVLGYQVWAVDEDGDVVYLGESDGDATEFLVESEPDGASYWVTAFYDTPDGLGFVEDVDNLPAFADLRDAARPDTTAVADEGGFPWWGWLLIGLGGLILVGAIVLLVLRARRGRAQDAGWGDEEPEAGSGQQGQAWDTPEPAVEAPDAAAPAAAPASRRR